METVAQHDLQFARVVHVIDDQFNVVTNLGTTCTQAMPLDEAVRIARSMNLAVERCGYKPHVHKLPNGLLASCFHKCRSSLLNWQFWAGLTLGFPLEHALWEKVWPLKLLTHWLGL